MLAEDVQKAVEKEFEMALQDRVMEETKDKKNAVEAYVYDMRNKVFYFTLYYFPTNIIYMGLGIPTHKLFCFPAS